MSKDKTEPVPAADDDEAVELFSPPCLLSELDPNWLEAEKPRRKRDDDKSAE